MSNIQKAESNCRSGIHIQGTALDDTERTREIVVDDEIVGDGMAGAWGGGQDSKERHTIHEVAEAGESNENLRGTPAQITSKTSVTSVSEGLGSKGPRRESGYTSPADGSIAGDRCRHTERRDTIAAARGRAEYSLYEKNANADHAEGAVQAGGDSSYRTDGSDERRIDGTTSCQLQPPISSQRDTELDKPSQRRRSLILMIPGAVLQFIRGAAGALTSRSREVEYDIEMQGSRTVQIRDHINQNLAFLENNSNRDASPSTTSVNRLATCSESLEVSTLQTNNRRNDSSNGMTMYQKLHLVCSAFKILLKFADLMFQCVTHNWGIGN